MGTTRHLVALLLAAALMPSPVFAAGAPCYRGVNLSGGEYGERGAIYATNYIYPSEQTIRYFAEKGMSIIRLPFRWERLQPALGGRLDEDEFKRIKDTVGLIRKQGMAVLLDPHNFGYYDKAQVGTAPATDAAFADFWARLAVEFANQDGVLFGLMNEPHDIKATDWLDAANAAIRAIRAVGARNLILVPGTAWSGAHSWEEDVIGGANGTVMLGVRDPLDFYAYEVHQYLDVDSSGTHASCEGAAAAVEALAGVTSWLKRNHKRGFLGEFGGSADKDCMSGLTKIYAIMSGNSDVWLGWSYWAAGEWWPADEAFNVQPYKGTERPQMQLLAASAKADAGACTAVKTAGN
ncbi:glycoside hydrolase family 5 protein [Rhizobium etli]|uniref:Glycoside hydrolase family 5 protein n=1 Tax=Rhizobium etli TaxID=29449 RepID=A0AAN1BBY7_RHIET|nr:glycoside hydrolase family 5 protein [Rhizobium etli]AGS20104.1 glycoside hydrolase family 5 protein [Rhizobium etli bv. mimosae str. Mim1]ARQ08334.1 glycoside hydrolase family 5 protein [Rhizobium etli]